MLFKDLNLIAPILEALETEGYTHPTPIQQQAIPHLLQGRDVMGCAQTGTGKTAAFAIPMLQLLSQRQVEKRNGAQPIRALVLTPTRELAIQIQESFETYGRHLNLRHAVIFGGVGQHPQVQTLRKGVDILVATPGRLLDLVQQGFVKLDKIEFFVLDEADRMLDMGFVHDVRKVLQLLPLRKQTLFFSATMPKEIRMLADDILYKPVSVQVAPVSSTADTVQQKIYFVNKEDKKKLLIHLLSDNTMDAVLVFTRTKYGADKVVKDLKRTGISAEAIHGNKSQEARQRALRNFKSRATRVLVATDIAARGIDIDDLMYVINFELPNVPETYVHRIGRTGRAGASGIALSFCDGEEVVYLRDIQKLISRQLEVASDQPYHCAFEQPKLVVAPSTKTQGRRSGGNRRNKHRGRSGNQALAGNR